MELNISDIINDSIVDGPGFRMTVFVQGCPHRCEGCHNLSTHSYAKKRIMEADEIFDKFKSNPLLKGITLSGGEPFSQAEGLTILAKKIRDYGKDVLVYSGYTFEQLISGDIPFAVELLNQCDYLIDGKFVLAQRDLTLSFRGSKNQRMIDVKQSLTDGHVVEIAL